MTNDDLQQFKKLLEENNKQQDENLQKRLAENNKQLEQNLRQNFQKQLDAAVDPIHERLDVQREQITTVEKNLTGQINAVEKNLRQNIKEDIKESEKNIIEQFSPITNLVLDHDEQIEELQKAVGLNPKQ